MLSPLFGLGGQSIFFDDDFDETWDMSTFDRDAAALSDMAEFWADVEAETANMAMVLPADVNGSPEDINDWAIRSQEESEEHKEKLVHHDCMWTGYCGDSGHPSNTFVSTEPLAATIGRSLLKRAPPPTRPETPQSLDEEEPPQFQHTVDIAGAALRHLRDSAAVAADHSYTLAKPPVKIKLENLGVQTPSDSEEEIDVVSLGEKTDVDVETATVAYTRAESLPHVPSAHDRHRIQRTVASAMSPSMSRGAPRKRPAPLASPPARSPPRKRARGPGRRPRRLQPDTDSDPDAPDMEKRSLHNDMERMRRIGLKNLFDQLKEEVPSIRDKERAPKVVILREAANHCRRLRADADERDTLQREQAKLLAKLKRLRAQYGARFRAP